MATNNSDIETRLWDAADKLWANTGLRPSEYAAPVLGLIFLRYAEARFAEAEAQIGQKASSRRKVGKTDYQALGVMYLPDQSRFSQLLQRTEGENIGKAINDAMKGIEDENEDLKGALPHTFNLIPNWVLVELLKSLAPINIPGDAFGRVYEYFMGNFAKRSMQKGGEFYTPASIVDLIVEIIEPYHGRIFDPACGSGGMFVHSAAFVKRHKKAPSAEISVFGTEKTVETLRMAKLNLAVHGLSGDIREANTYYEDPHNCCDKLGGRFDFVMANPPFNVSGVDKERIKDDPRYPFGVPNSDNANYLWIQLFYAALNSSGRAGFVMANSAGDARGTELEIRKRLILDGVVDVIVSVGPNFFYTVTLPCTLWFLDRGKQKTDRKDKILFIDARHIFRQIDRAHRDFTDTHIEFIANIARMYRGEPVELSAGSKKMMEEHFPDGRGANNPGLCKLATIAEIEAEGWSLNPSRYVGVADRAADEFDFFERLESLHEEFEMLSGEARQIESRIATNVAELLLKAI